MHITIVYEDDEVLVINKPAGMTVNRAETTKHQETVQDWAEEKLKIKDEISKRDTVNKKFGEEGWDPSLDFYTRGGIVHRLDKETSGILIIAKTPTAFVNLQKQFHDRIVKKVYVALAHGEVKPGTGEISVPVGRLPWNRNKFGILPGGRDSKTTYKTIAYYQDAKTKETLTLLELYPETGRTHQIRVHLQYLHHPIFADFLYAGRKTSRKDRKILERVFLHAAKISFNHPVTGNSLSFEAPLSEELTECLNTFQKAFS